MKPVALDYVRATSVEEAIAMLAGDDDAKPIAGGQSLVPALNLRLVRPTRLVDLNRAGLDTIELNGEVTIGATVRQAAAARDARVHPLLREALPHVGHHATRNRGTIGGSLAHADAAAEISVCLAALDGRVVVAGPQGVREVPAEAFFVTHYTTTLSTGELVVASRWPLPTAGSGFAFEELALRAGDYALATAAVALRRVDGVASDVRVVVGAVCDRPLVVTAAGDALAGTGVEPAELEAAVGAVSDAIDPYGSIHAGPEYLRHITGELVRRAIRRAWESAA